MIYGEMGSGGWVSAPACAGVSAMLASPSEVAFSVVAVVFPRSKIDWDAVVVLFKLLERLRENFLAPVLGMKCCQ